MAISRFRPPIRGPSPLAVTNTGHERVTWGRGSSSCQLSMYVVVEGVRHSISHGICTANLGEQGLDPGETLTEVFEWGGEVHDIEGEPFLLPDGRYPLIGMAGGRAESRPLWVMVAR